MSHRPTAEQAAIVDASTTGQDLVVEAGAGTGKTSTLQLLADANPRRRGIYLAFNKAIAADACCRFPRTVQCKTSHALAFQAVGRQYAHRLNAPRMPARETARALRINDPIKVVSELGPLAPTQLARIAMQTVERFCYSGDAQVEAWHVPRLEGLAQPLARQALASVIVPYARRAWEDLTRLDGQLRFTHDCYLKLWALSGPKLPVDYVLLDEAQDSNGALAGIVDAQDAQRILVGDRSQAIYCQPAGTVVTVVRGRYKRGVPSVTEDVPIEQVKVGDRVVSYGEKSRVLRRAGAMVTRNEVLDHDGDLFTITTVDGKSSNYTPDHHCVIRWSRPSFRAAWLVYMMRRGDDYRIGSTAAVHGSQDGRHGLAIRIGQEAPDEAWILGAYDLEEEARQAELSFQTRYAIPGWTFRAPSGNPTGQDELDQRWVQRGPTLTEAAKAVEEIGRDLDQPLWKKGDALPSFRASMVVTARNLLSGMAVLDLERADQMPAGKGITYSAWRPFFVERSYFAGPVYSLSVATDHTYFADGLLTHNSWRGAVDAMATFQGRRLQLSKSFRFGPHIAYEANKWLAILDAPLRLTGHEPIRSEVVSLQAPDGPDAVLCRTNAEAVRQASTAIMQGIKPALVGGGDDVRRLAEAAIDLIAGRGTAHPELMAFSSWFEVLDYVAQDSAGSDLQVAVSLIEKYTPAGVLQILEQLVDEQHADVVLSTAHKAKGREWRSIRIADDFREPRRSEDNPDPELPRADAMLAYVAVTRAQLVLDRFGLEWVDRWTPAHLIDRPSAAALLEDDDAIERHLRQLAVRDVPPAVVAAAAAAIDWPEPIPVDEPPADLPPAPEQPGDPGDGYSPECYRCGHHYTACTCTLMPDRRPLARATP